MTTKLIQWDDTSDIPVSKKITTLSNPGSWLSLSSPINQNSPDGVAFEMGFSYSGTPMTFWRGTFFPELNFSTFPKNGIILKYNTWYTPGGVSLGISQKLLTMKVPCSMIGNNYECMIPGGSITNFDLTPGNTVKVFASWKESDGQDALPSWVYNSNGNFICKNGKNYFALIEKDGKAVLSLLEGTIDSLSKNDLNMLSFPDAIWIDETGIPPQPVPPQPEPPQPEPVPVPVPVPPQPEPVPVPVPPQPEPVPVPVPVPPQPEPVPVPVPVPPQPQPVRPSKTDKSFLEKYKWWIVGGLSLLIILIIAIFLIIYYQRKNQA